MKKKPVCYFKIDKKKTCCNCKILNLAKSIEILTLRVISIILTDKIPEKNSIYRGCRGDSSNSCVLDYLRHCQLVCYHGNCNVRHTAFNMADQYEENLNYK